MSSSSSDSDSDDFEPIRRIKINIKPKDTIATRDGADIEAIKASVEAWRPLGPRPHPSLSRRQSSLSSVSSLSFGTASGSVYGGSNSKAATATDSSSANTNLNQYYNQSGYGTTKGMTINNYTNSSMRSSPSCSSLVNEFTNRTSFSNFMPNASRTSSPLTFMSSSTNSHSDTVPIALAIQESIELTVKGQHKPTFNGCDVGKKFDTRALGNIKVAFPNSFARLCSLDDGTSREPGAKQIPTLKLRLHSTENIIRYYASGLVKDLDSEQSSLAESVNTPSNESNNNNHHFGTGGSTELFENQQNFQIDPFDLNESPTKVKYNSKVIEFDMDALVRHLKQLYDQTPNMRYYNVDVLRYQITPIDQFEKFPLQVSAYWKLESKLIKLRLDFKHSNQSGFNLERLREISFIANLSNLVPPGLSIKPVSPNQVSTLTRPSSYSTTNNCNLEIGNTHKNVTNMIGGSDSSYSIFDCSNDRTSMIQPRASTQADKLQHDNVMNLIDVNPTREDASASLIQHTQHPIVSQPQPQPAPRQLNNNLMQMRLPPPPSSGHSRHNHQKSGLSLSNPDESLLSQQSSPFIRSASNNSSARSGILSLISGTPGATNPRHDVSQINQAALLAAYQSPSDMNDAMILRPSVQQVPPSATGTSPPSMPYITFEPQASWDDQTRQLTWKFDNLLAFYKSDGSGSLLAKLDFRHCNEIPPGFIDRTVSIDDPLQNQSITPQPVDIKFMAVDSTLSKISLTIDSAGYRMSLLKKEIRSGRYKSEPCTF